MSPTFDLSPAGLSNELDGDPDRLDSLVGNFRRNADNLTNSAEALRRIRHGEGEIASKTFSELLNKAQEVEMGVRQAADYYKFIASAVAQFVPVLREAQRQAPGQLEQLIQSRERSDSARMDHERARTLARNPDPQVQQQALDLAGQASSAHATANHSLESARHALRAAADRVREANNVAAAKVADAPEHAGIEDSVLDHLGKFAGIVLKIGAWIWEHIDAILLFLTIISFFVPFGPILSGIFMAVRVLAKAKHIVSQVQTGWDIAQKVAKGDVAGVVGGLVSIGASYALGKVAKGAARKLGRATGKALFSLDKQGRLHTTKTGHMVHSFVDKFGQKINTRTISRHIDRTTHVITRSTEWVYKKGLKLVTKEITQAMGRAAERAIEHGLKILKDPPPLLGPPPRRYPGTPTVLLPGGGGGGGGW